MNDAPSYLDPKRLEEELITLRKELIAKEEELIQLSEKVKKSAAIEEEANRDRENFRSFFENAPIGKSMTHIDGTLIKVNKAFADMLGYSREEMKETNFAKITFPDDLEKSKESIRVLLASKQKNFSFEKRYIHKNKSIIWTNVCTTLQYDELNNPIYFLTHILDISERKKYEIKLEESEERYLLATTASDNGIWDWKLETDEIYYSPQWKAQIGYLPNELKDEFKTWEDHLHPEEYDSKVKAVKDYLKNPVGDFKLEFRFRHKDGSYRWIFNKSSAVLNDQGEVIRMFGAHTDITDRKRIEMELKESVLVAQKATIYKNNFLSNMSHEIRTPMNGIIGFAGLLRDDSLRNDQREKYVNIIDKSGKQLLNVIDDIIDLAKIEAGELKINKNRFNLNKELIDLKTLFEQLAIDKGKADLNFVLNLPKNKVSSLYTDLNRFKQIMINLLSNALKFTEKGSIELGYTIAVIENPVDTEIGSEKGETFLSKREKDSIAPTQEILFYVKDSGIGIPKDKFETIFDRFQQSSDETVVKYGGTGLGLSISKKIIEMFGGKIWVESEENQGSVFYFNHPITLDGSIEDSVIKEESSSIKNDDLKGIKILLAEDIVVNQEFIIEVLDEYDVEIDIANHGKEAIELYQKNKDYDLVLMDLRMPVLNGFIALEKILELNPKAIVIAQTAYALNEEREKCFKAGFADVITKPINAEELINKICKHINRSKS